MSIEITTASNPDEWNDLVEMSSQATPFHRYESLSVIADHSNATLYPYIGVKGQEPVGLFPFFEISKGPFSTAFSPPPNLKVYYLGPILLNHKKQKQRRLQQTNKRFIHSCIEQMKIDIDPHFSHVYLGFNYTDGRPFIWEEFDITLRYTYLVDLQRSADDLIMSFSSDARKNIQGADKDDYEITLGGETEIERTNEYVRMRHEEQDATYNVPSSYIIDLYRKLPDDMMNVYVCEVDGEFVGGHITFELGGVIYAWQSWGSFNTDIAVNDLLHWEVMTDAMERGNEWYDLVGATFPRISKYKAKFNPELRTYQRAQKGLPGMKLASELYKKIR